MAFHDKTAITPLDSDTYFCGRFTRDCRAVVSSSLEVAQKCAVGRALRQSGRNEQEVKQRLDSLLRGSTVRVRIIQGPLSFSGDIPMSTVPPPPAPVEDEPSQRASAA